VLRHSKHVSLFLSLWNGSYLVNGGRTRHTDSQSKSTIVNIAPAKETLAHDDWFGDKSENKRYG
jgi:hypothetical protein